MEILSSGKSDVELAYLTTMGRVVPGNRQPFTALTVISACPLVANRTNAEQLIEDPPLGRMTWHSITWPYLEKISTSCWARKTKKQEQHDVSNGEIGRAQV